MAERVNEHRLKNGLVILGEPMETVGSVAFGFMIPAGAARLPEGCCGAANVISDWIFRGAGGRNSRELGDALDGLGLHRSSSVTSSHLTIGAALEAGNLAEALSLYCDVITQPRLSDDEFEPARQLAIDEVRGLDDDPRRKVMLKLYEGFYPYPLGRSTVGDIDQLQALSPERVRDIVRSSFGLSEAILAVAGKYDFDAVCRQLENALAAETPPPLPQEEPRVQQSRYTHLPNDGAQVHIGLMTGTVKPADEDYYNARMAVAVLSGGMSARLFTEVREKRGLCYAVGARYHALKDFAGIACYAGTTPEKAQETLDVIIEQFDKLSEGITEEELQRAKVGLKSSLILQSESSSSRAGAIGADYYMLGRVRTLDEIKSRIEQVTRDSVMQFLRNNKFKDYTVVTIGPKKVTVKQS